MKLFTIPAVLIISNLITMPATGQNKDKALFRNTVPGFFQNNIVRDDEDFKDKVAPASPDRNFVIDLTSVDLPNKMDIYKSQYWHNPPVSQGNDDARQLRFFNNSTTDDHGMHLVGNAVKNGNEWFLIKDSGSGSRNNDPKAKEFGYYFFSEDYIKLKMMDFMVHKDAVKDLLP